MSDTLHSGESLSAGQSLTSQSFPVASPHVDQQVGHRKWMVTDALLYRNGILTVQTASSSGHWTEALRGHVFVIVVDDQSRAIWVSKDFRCTTRCSRADLTCASGGTDTFTENLPEVVGRLAQRLDVYQYEEGGGGDHYRRNLINGIHNLQDVAQELKDAIRNLS